MNQDGVVYQRSLGENTARTAAAMNEYNPDKGWTVVQEPGITNLTAAEPARESTMTADGEEKSKSSRSASSAHFPLAGFELY